ncbi:MAG: LacI family DNA-binding transcriptional regulator [Planctomycetota bacterium]
MANVTLQTIADEAKIDRGTVSRILSGKGRAAGISQGRIDRVQRIARDLKFRPNAGARSLRIKRHRQVGVLLHANSRRLHIAQFDTVMGFVEEMERFDYAVHVIRLSHTDDSDESPDLRIFREQMLDGVMLLDSLDERITDKVEYAASSIVWVNHNRFDTTSCLRRDERAAGEVAATELHRLGYQRAIYIDGKPQGIPHFSHQARREGFLNTAQRSGLAASHETLPTSSTEDQPPDWLRQNDAETVLVAGTHYHARKLQSMLSYLGIRPGRDVGVACLDEVSETHSTWQTLARVSFDRWQLGVQAATMLKQAIDGHNAPPSITISSSWHPGLSAPGPVVP